ncbi:hypothetical protein IW261DRAFT_1424965 [Armillaria novae-zelandiae]|uniref:Uncharacterized protein n=1 Tax=Armillaria novae-zelandiae TaxID=153914 RepID=A0AA39NUI8_9AGAR|nr:hypothetical protein IW261DRAFT_1424965 [Armillaria novae-zelandiae]
MIWSQISWLQCGALGVCTLCPKSPDLGISVRLNLTLPHVENASSHDLSGNEIRSFWGFLSPTALLPECPLLLLVEWNVMFKESGRAEAPPQFPNHVHWQYHTLVVLKSPAAISPDG